MNNNTEKNQAKSRREFLSSVVRGAIGGGLAVTGGYLLLRDDPGELCPINFACDRCTGLRECTLPEATAFKVKERQHPETKN